MTLNDHVVLATDDNYLTRVIIQNEIQCLNCKDIIFSKHRHDYVTCSCEGCAVDGGLAYLRRVGVTDRNYTDRSLFMRRDTLKACVKAVQTAVDQHKNHFGIVLAVLRAFRNNNLLDLTKFTSRDEGDKPQ